MKSFLPLFLVLSGLVMVGCTDKEDEDFSVVAAKDYFALAPGKYIIYRADSTVFTQQGRAEERHVYQEKDVVNAPSTDALGRPSYVVYRYLRDSAGTGAWGSFGTGTYFITPTATGVEVTDDNMRVIKLASPVKQSESWKGNSYLATEPYFLKFPANFGNDDNMNDWDFRITNTGETVTLNGKTYKDVITVLHVDEKNLPDTIIVANNKAQISATVQGVWLTGTATDTVVITGTTPRSGAVRIDNHTNKPAKLGSYITDAGKGRSFEFFNGNWRYANNRDSVYNDPPFATKSYSVEKYAKGIGLIYQDLILWEYQPNIGGTPFKVGFGIKRTILDHN
jgi:hypothetical protein